MAKEWALDDVYQLHRDCLKQLKENLLDGEPVLVILRGSWDQAMIATDRRVFVFKKGQMGGVTFGSKLASWDFGSISGIHSETGWLSGFVMIQGPGISAADRSSRSGGKFEPREAPNAIVFGTGPEADQVNAGVPIIRKLILEFAERQRHEQTPAQADDPMSLLERLAKLKEVGAITEDEFLVKKAELLARI